ncbi:16387_t:CDS:2 [Entrophospora sp. SA101]|nr:16387_t:CDS:2 [Entrophospora sp. SA101]
MLDTMGQLANFSPPTKRDPSHRIRDENIKLLPPFINVMTFDALDYKLKDHPNHCLLFGRPLWGSNLTKPIEYIFNDEENRFAVSLAILSCLVSLDISTQSQLTHLLVGSYMGTCIGVSKSRENILTIRFVLDRLETSLKNGLVEAGHRGELVAHLILTFGWQHMLQAINTAIAKEKIGAIPGFFVGGVAACGAVTFTNPWEVVKTRLQLQGELARGNSNYIKPYTNVFQAFSMIVRREGLRGIQKGIGPAYVYQLVMNGSRLGFYDPIRNSLIGFLNVSNTSMPISILSGGLAGVIGAALGSPFYLVKTRMQSHSQHIMAVGHQHSYKNTFDALKQISKKGGIKDLFRGVDAAMLRTGVGSATQLSSYFYIKRWTIQETGLTDSDILVHVFSSLLSGLCVCTAMNPFDVISTRMYNQKVEKTFIRIL